MFTTQDVSAVVCTRNSISGIKQCLESLQRNNVNQIIVVDAHSTDGSREVADQLAHTVIEDPGIGLGYARNLGIAQTTGDLILNVGSDNVFPDGSLQELLNEFESAEVQGMSTQTRIEGEDYLSAGLNAWRRGRFLPGPASVIGTPTLFIGELLRKYPYDPTRRFSDDSELCERWAEQFNAKFAISNVEVLEVGKTSWPDFKTRAQMYGISDAEVFREGSHTHQWSNTRKVKSILHPLRVDFFHPIRNIPVMDALKFTPYFATFTAIRYKSWFSEKSKSNKQI